MLGLAQNTDDGWLSSLTGDTGYSCFMWTCSRWPFPFPGKTVLKNVLGKLSNCVCKALMCRWQPRLGLNSLGFKTAQLLLLICPCLLCMDCPQDCWWIFHSGVFKRKVCHSSSRSSSITAAIRVVRGKRWNHLFSFFLPSPSPPHGSEPVGKCCGVSGMILAHVGRGMLLADSSEVGLVSLRCGWVRGKQSFNYLLGTWRIL